MTWWKSNRRNELQELIAKLLIALRLPPTNFSTTTEMSERKPKIANGNERNSEPGFLDGGRSANGEVFRWIMSSPSQELEVAVRVEEDELGREEEGRESGHHSSVKVERDLLHHWFLQELRFLVGCDFSEVSSESESGK